MTELLSVRLESGVKKRLELLAKCSQRSKSFHAAEAISRYLEAEEWQLGEIHKGIEEADSGKIVDHEKVAKWLRSWGTRREKKPPQ